MNKNMFLPEWEDHISVFYKPMIYKCNVLYILKLWLQKHYFKDGLLYDDLICLLIILVHHQCLDGFHTFVTVLSTHVVS